MIKQLSILVSNRPGQLEKVTEVMMEVGVNCLSISTYDAADFGVLQLIVDKPDELSQALEQQGYSLLVRSVIAVAMENEIGYLNKILKTLRDANVNIDCVYSFVSKKLMKPVLVFRAEDADVVENRLKTSGFTILKSIENLMD